MSNHGDDAHAPLLDPSEAIPKTSYGTVGSAANNLIIGDISDDEEEEENLTALTPPSDSSRTWADTVCSRTFLMSTALASWALSRISLDKTIGGNLIGASPYILGIATVCALPYLERKRSEIVPTIWDWLENWCEEDEGANTDTKTDLVKDCLHDPSLEGQKSENPEGEESVVGIEGQGDVKSESEE